MQSSRRSMLFISANNPKMLQDAPVFEPDSVVIDLADRVEATEKDSARLLVKEALSFLDFSKVEVVVRINPLDTEDGVKDLGVIGRAKPDAIMLPKATAGELREVDKILATIEQEQSFPPESIKLIPVIDTFYAVEDVYNITKASPRIVGALLNAKVLTAELGMTRTKDGDEILYARSRVAMACRAAGIDVIDTPFPEGNDTEDLEKDSAKAKGLGFTGKVAVDVRQIETINSIFSA